MNDFNINQFLDTTIDAMDFQSMISDVNDFLEFSEQNIDWQHRRELQSITLRTDLKDDPDYCDSLEQSADHRFKVSLLLRIRYSALLSFVTSVEWSVTFLNQSAVTPIPAKKNGVNHTVKILHEFSNRVALNSMEIVANYEALVKLRNCIAHYGGVLHGYPYKDDLPNAVARIRGITIERWHFFGDQICIARGALEDPIQSTAKLVLELHKQMREQGMLKLA